MTWHKGSAYIVAAVMTIALAAGCGPVSRASNTGSQPVAGSSATAVTTAPAGTPTAPASTPTASASTPTAPPSGSGGTTTSALASVQQDLNAIDAASAQADQDVSAGDAAQAQNDSP